MRNRVIWGILLTLTACGGSQTPTAPGPPPTTLPPRGAYTVAVSPSPILAVASGRSDYPWSATWRVTITDVAGLDGNVNRVVTTARNNFGYTFVASDYNPNDFLMGVGTNNIPRGSNLTYTDRMTYRADGNGGQQLTLTIAAEIIDAYGNHITAASDVRVTDVGRSIAAAR